MKAAIELNATPRETLGKGGSRALRREARVPVVVYANGKNTLSLSIDGNSVANEYFKGGFMSKIVALKVDGKDVFAIPRDVQLNPVSDKIEHVDFLHVDEKSVVKVTVPVHFLNTEKSVGIKRGGVLNIVAHTVELLCPVNAIPKALEIDIAALNIGDSVPIHSVALPTGVKPATTPSHRSPAVRKKKPKRRLQRYRLAPFLQRKWLNQQRVQNQQRVRKQLQQQNLRLRNNPSREALCG